MQQSVLRSAVLKGKQKERKRGGKKDDSWTRVKKKEDSRRKRLRTYEKQDEFQRLQNLSFSNEMYENELSRERSDGALVNTPPSLVNTPPSLVNDMRSLVIPLAGEVRARPASPQYER